MYTNGGDIVLVAGEEGFAYVEAERTADDEDEARRLRVNVAVEGDALRVRWDGKGGHGRDVSFRVRVPSWLPARLETDGGNVSVGAMKAGVEAVSDGGSVSNDFGLPTSERSGRASFEGALGDGGEGSLQLRTDGGRVRLHRAP